jgi:hypothetical protein
MCDCKSKANEKLRALLGVDNGSINFEFLSGRTYSEFKYNEKGKTRVKVAPVMHSFCPFCGQPYVKENEVSSEQKTV